MRLFRRKQKENEFETEQRLVPAEKVCGPKGGRQAPDVKNIRIVHQDDGGGFSVAIGQWDWGEIGVQEENQEMLLVRWNGNKDSAGYPYASSSKKDYGKRSPNWFPIPPVFNLPILLTLREHLADNQPEALAKSLGLPVSNPNDC